MFNGFYPLNQRCKFRRKFSKIKRNCETLAEFRFRLKFRPKNEYRKFGHNRNRKDTFRVFSKDRARQFLFADQTRMSQSEPRSSFGHIGTCRQNDCQLARIIFLSETAAVGALVFAAQHSSVCFNKSAHLLEPGEGPDQTWKFRSQLQQIVCVRSKY